MSLTGGGQSDRDNIGVNGVAVRVSKDLCDCEVPCCSRAALSGR